MKQWILILMIGLLAGQLLAQSDSLQAYIAYVRHYGVEQGISHRALRCVHEDRQGLIWLGTDP